MNAGEAEAAQGAAIGGDGEKREKSLGADGPFHGSGKKIEQQNIQQKINRGSWVLNKRVGEELKRRKPTVLEGIKLKQLYDGESEPVLND